MAGPFRSAPELLVQYARHHRDRRNIVTHLVGVPMSVVGLGVLLARPQFVLDGIVFTAAWLVFGAAAAWNLTRGRLGLGLSTTFGLGLLTLAAHRLAEVGTGPWLALGAGLFVLGWALQLLGHYYEGPAVADEPPSQFAGPMFVVMELLARTGMFRGLVGEIERDAGPTFIRDLAQPAAQ